MTSHHSADTCCDEFARTDRARLNRRGFLRDRHRARRRRRRHHRARDRLHLDVVRRRAGRPRAGGALHARGLRRPQPRRPARRPGLLRGPAEHRRAVRPAARPRTASSACTRPWHRWCRGGPPARWPPSTPTGLPAPNRSHFSAMEEVEDADPGSDARVGWLNRLIGRNGTGSPIEAIQFGGGVPDTAVSGPEPVLVTSDADSVTLSGRGRRRVEAPAPPVDVPHVGATLPGPLGGGARTALDVVEQFAPVTTGSAAPANRRGVPDELRPGPGPRLGRAHHPGRHRGRGDHRRPRLLGPPHLDRAARQRQPPPDGRRVRAERGGVHDRPRAARGPGHRGDAQRVRPAGQGERQPGARPRLRQRDVPARAPASRAASTTAPGRG